MFELWLHSADAVMYLCSRGADGEGSGGGGGGSGDLQRMVFDSSVSLSSDDGFDHGAPVPNGDPDLLSPSVSSLEEVGEGART